MAEIADFFPQAQTRQKPTTIHTFPLQNKKKKTQITELNAKGSSPGKMLLSPRWPTQTCPKQAEPLTLLARRTRRNSESLNFQVRGLSNRSSIYPQGNQEAGLKEDHPHDPIQYWLFTMIIRTLCCASTVELNKVPCR